MKSYDFFFSSTILSTSSHVVPAKFDLILPSNSRKLFLKSLLYFNLSLSSMYLKSRLFVLSPHFLWSGQKFDKIFELILKGVRNDNEHMSGITWNLLDFILIESSWQKDDNEKTNRENRIFLTLKLEKLQIQTYTPNSEQDMKVILETLEWFLTTITCSLKKYLEIPSMKSSYKFTNRLVINTNIVIIIWWYAKLIELKIQNFCRDVFLLRFLSRNTYTCGYSNFHKLLPFIIIIWQAEWLHTYFIFHDQFDPRHRC